MGSDTSVSMAEEFLDEASLIAFHCMCQRLLQHAKLQDPSKDFTIPTTEVHDPVLLWDYVDPLTNNGRFIVFIEWLWQQPHSFRFFSRLVQEREGSLLACINRLQRSLDGEEAQAAGIVRGPRRSG